MDYDETTGVRNADKVVLFSEALATAVKDTVNSDQFALVLGGDCSVLIGCTLGLKSYGNYGLFFIDGHTDYVLPHSSFTKGAAAMDLAIVNGNRHLKLTNISNSIPYAEEENVFAFGNREYDKEYVGGIERSAIHYYDLRSIRSTGVSIITKKFIEMIEEKKLDGFWIHFDVDVLDDQLMPAVDSRQEDGLSYAELGETLQPLLESGYAAGMDITILDPDLDEEGKYTQPFVKEMLEIFQNAKR